ncbi:MAG TPA: hypothetical protein VE861_03545 [Gemmatimonadaceae bacterium]|nr:hypothetical protein [Gemmatimonadaceae bacterium]
MSVITTSQHCFTGAGPRNIAARRLVGAALACIGMVTTTGCYAFIPTTSTTLAEATPVTVKLTAGGSVALQQVLGNAVNEVEGSVLRSSADSLVVAVQNTYTTARQKFATSGTTAAIPRAYIQEVQVRTFSRKRTTLMIIGGVAVAAGAAAVATSSGSGGNGSGNPPTTASVRQPE